MSNSSDRNSRNQEVRQEFYRDPNGTTHTNVTRTTETVNNNRVADSTDSYRNGYVQGRVNEHLYEEEILTERDNNNAARGLLLGIILTSLAALAAGAVWLLNQRNEAPTQVLPPVIVPNSQPQTSPSPEAKQPPQKETIIEKTRDVLVPVPQPQAPSPAPQQDVNISIPNSASQQPASQQVPKTTTPTQSQNSSSSNTPARQGDTSTNTTPAQNSQSNIDTTTPSSEMSDQTSPTSDSSSTRSETSNPSSSAQ